MKYFFIPGFCGYPSINTEPLQLRCLLLCALLFSGNVFSKDSADIDEMTEQSDFVFEGSVTRVDYRFTAPSTDEGPNLSLPYTYVTYQVNNIYKGNSRSSTVTLRFAGGPSENVGEYMLFAGQPLFDANDHDILFVSGNEISPCPLLDCANGRLRVIDNMVVNDEGRPVTVNDDGTLTFGAALDLEDINTHNMNDVITLQRQEFDEYGNPLVLHDPNNISREGVPDATGFGELLQERVLALYSEEELAALPEFVSANPNRPMDEDIANYFGSTATQDGNGDAGQANDPAADTGQQQREQISRSSWKKLAVADTAGSVTALSNKSQDAGLETEQAGARSMFIVFLLALIPAVYFLIRRFR
jgi:hypothetical protein